MFFSKIISNKLNRHLIEDVGYMWGGTIADSKYTNSNIVKPQKSDEQILLEYLKIVKEISTKSEEIKKLETKRVELFHEIMNNPTLKEMFENFINDDVKKISKM